jgi:hypothetical protein
MTNEFRFDDAYESVYTYDDDAGAYVYLMAYSSAGINSTQALPTKVRRVRRKIDIQNMEKALTE